MADKIELPVIIPNRLLISPGVWNDNEYTAMEIGEGFARTDWVDKNKIALWLNHDDRNTSAFVGYVKNPVLASQGRVFGDLELWDEKIATLLTQAMAKFGVSAKIKGEEDEKGKMKNFSFENFSIVTVPACSEAYINLSKKDKVEKIVSKYLLSKDDILEDTKKNESSEDISERRLKENMVEEEKKEEVVEEKSEEAVVEESAPAEKELSEKDLLKELTVKFDKLVNLLSKKLSEEEEEDKEEVKEEATIDEEGESLLPAKEDENSEPKEEVVVEAGEAKELTAVKKELAEIKAKLNAPKSKTIRNLSSNSVGDDAKYSADTFCDMLKATDKPMKFI